MHIMLFAKSREGLLHQKQIFSNHERSDGGDPARQGQSAKFDVRPHLALLIGDQCRPVYSHDGDDHRRKDPDKTTRWSGPEFVSQRGFRRHGGRSTPWEIGTSRRSQHLE